MPAVSATRSGTACRYESPEYRRLNLASLLKIFDNHVAEILMAVRLSGLKEGLIQVAALGEEAVCRDAIDFAVIRLDAVDFEIDEALACRAVEIVEGFQA